MQVYPINCSPRYYGQYMTFGTLAVGSVMRPVIASPDSDRLIRQRYKPEPTALETAMQHGRAILDRILLRS